MKRTNIYDDNNNYVGWFDIDTAKLLARQTTGGAYKHYLWIYLTKGGKIIRSDSDNTTDSRDFYSIAKKLDAVEAIIAAGTDAGEKWLASVPECSECEIK